MLPFGIITGMANHGAALGRRVCLGYCIYVFLSIYSHVLCVCTQKQQYTSIPGTKIALLLTDTPYSTAYVLHTSTDTGIDAVTICRNNTGT